MAMTRRGVLALPLWAGAAAGCASIARRTGGGGYLELASGGASAAAATILVAMPDTPQTRQVWSGLSDELGKQYRLVAVRVTDPGAADVIAEGVRRYTPAALVLMNNPTVAAYRSYQRSAGGDRFPPAVIVMTSFLTGRVTHVTCATGISYEVPLITVVTNLRRLIASPLERIGVIVRGSQHAFVAGQAALAQREQIHVIEQEVSADPNSSELKWAMRRIKDQIDALWVLNDDHLLTPRLIAEGWLPGLNERPYRPTIVGAASLVSAKQPFGTFAVLPDHIALGAQAAGLLFDIADAGWRIPEDAQVQLPLSTTTAVDLVQARAHFSLREDALRQVDRVLDQD